MTSSGTVSSTWYNVLGQNPEALRYNLDPALIQSWIDSPSIYKGIALQQQVASIEPSRFSSLIHGFDNVPTLRVWVTPVPEPGGVVLVCAAGMVTLLRRRRSLTQSSYLNSWGGSRGCQRVLFLP
jgi:hypothetical protein